MKSISLAQRIVNYFWGVASASRNSTSGSNLQRNYQAGSISRLSGDFPTSIISVDDSVSKNLKPLRGRSRHLYANNDYMRRFVGLLSSNVIGSNGIVLQAMSKDDGILDSVANDAIELAFKKWGSRSHCDVAGKYSWLTHQIMFIKTIAIEGEYLARKIYGNDAGEYGFSLQVLDPNLLDVDFNKKISAEIFVKHGIKFNSYGRAISYFILNPSSGSDYHFNGKRYTEIDASEIIHEFIPQQVGQKRGFPMASTAMLRMKMLGGYEDAALTAARLGASHMGFFKTMEGADGGGPGIAKVDENGDPIVNQSGDFVGEAEPGSFHVLPEGYDVSNFNPDYPHNQFGEFVKTCLRGVASGLEISYNTLANDLEGVNFSSIRQGVLEDREGWKMLQAFTIEVFCAPVYDDWLRYALLNKKITLPRGQSLRMSMIDKYREVRWQAKRWQWVDPVKDSKAAQIEEEMQWNSKSAIIREKGRDPVEVARERSRDDELFKVSEEGSSDAAIDKDKG